MKKKIILACVISCAIGGQAVASQTNFQFLNPSFGGNPLNAGYFLSLTESQKQIKEKEKQQTVAEQFSEQIQSRVLGTLVSGVVDKISKDLANYNGTGKPPKDSIEVGDIKVSYEVIGNEIQVSIFDGLSETSVSVPYTVLTNVNK